MKKFFAQKEKPAAAEQTDSTKLASVQALFDAAGISLEAMLAENEPAVLKNALEEAREDAATEARDEIRQAAGMDASVDIAAHVKALQGKVDASAKRETVLSAALAKVGVKLADHVKDGAISAETLDKEIADAVNRKGADIAAQAGVPDPLEQPAEGASASDDDGKPENLEAFMKRHKALLSAGKHLEAQRYWDSHKANF